MFNKITFYSAVGVFLVLVGFAFFGVAEAVNPFDITYPIAELGNCSSQGECKLFCDDSVNQTACFDWAADQGLVPEREVKRVRDMERFEKRGGDAVLAEDFGPGGCRTPQECDAFCRVESNLDECTQYSVDHGYMEQAEADRIREQVNQGGPGGCSSREECDTFCRNPENMRTCMQFVVDEGRITQEEADFMIMQAKKHGELGELREHETRGPDNDFDEKKAVELLQEVDGPGGCSGMDECEAFCGNPDNDEICMAFAIEHGLIPPEKAEVMEKMMKIGGPGGCRGPQECDEFCSQEENAETCMDFAVENGMMLPEEIEMMRKEIEIVKRLDEDTGPGGCKDPRECKDFCSNPENTNECMNFATKNGMMDERQADTMMGEMRQMEGMIRGREKFEERGGMFAGPPPGFNSSSEFEPPRGFEDHEMMPEDFRRGGSSPSDEGFEHGNFDPNRRDFERFDDFEEGGFRDEMFKEDFERRELNQEHDEGFAPQGMMPKDFALPDNMMPSDFSDFAPMDGVPMPYDINSMTQEGDGFVPPQDGFVPEDNFMPSTEGSFVPPENGFESMPQDFYQEPPAFEGGFIEGEPTSYVRPYSLLGSVIGPIIDILW